MKKVFYALLLLLVSGAVYAAGNIPGVDTNISAAAVNNHTDLSIAFLASVFGNVGSTLHGTSGQMLGVLFYKLNEGIVVLAGLWLAYTVVTIVLRSAQEGSFMGQNKNVALMFLRVALGIGMLVPNPSTGYSVLQDIVMKVVVQGVALADETWSYGLDYVGGNGSFWRRPMMKNFGKSQIISGDDAGKMMTNLSKQVFQSEVCMVASSMIPQATNSNDTNTGIANSGGNSTIPYHPILNAKEQKIQFPGFGNSPNSGGESCGYVSWHEMNGKLSAANNAFAQAAVTQMADNMLPAAKAYVCANLSSLGGARSEDCEGVSSSDLVNHNGEVFFGSFVNYLNSIMPIAQSAQQGTSKAAKIFIPDAKSSGWMTAGRYYWDLSRIQSHYFNVSNLTNYIPKKFGTGVPSRIEQTGIVKNAGEAAGSGKIAGTYIQTAVQKFNTYATASKQGDTGSSYPTSVHSGVNWVVDLLLGPVVANIAMLFTAFSTHMGPLGMGADPIMFLHRIGLYCINIAGGIWLSIAGVMFVVSLLTSVCRGTVDAALPLTNVAEWMKPVLMGVATIMLTVGVMLGYYVPMYPYMLFIFGVISWIISVIEAMVAAPLVALGLTHPDGHDFLGRSEQALMLLLGVFLRPVLMVIGLLSGMILSYVALRILVYTYAGFLQDVFYVAVPAPGSTSDILAGAAAATANSAVQAGGVTGLIMSILVFPLMLVMFAGLVYLVTTQCFSLIYVLPDYILRWIGGPQQQSMAAQMAQQMQGIVQATGKQAGETGQQAQKSKQDWDNQVKQRSDRFGGGTKKAPGKGRGKGKGKKGSSGRNNPTAITSNGNGRGRGRNG